MTIIIEDYKCNHSNLIKDGIYIVCSECGLVIYKDQLVNNEVRVFSNEDIELKRQHEIDNKFHHYKTTFDLRENNGKNSYYYKLNKYNKWDTQNKERLLVMRQKIKSFLTYLNIENETIIHETDYLILKFNDINLHRLGYNALAATIIYIAFRNAEIPINIKFLCKFFEIDHFSKFTFKIVQRYKIKVKPPPPLRTYVIYYLNKFIEILDIRFKKGKNKIFELAINWANLFEQSKYHNGSSNIICSATIIYFALDYLLHNSLSSSKIKYTIGITQLKICDYFMVTPSTLRTTRYKLVSLLTKFKLLKK